jgi:flagellar motor switch protein FliG
MNAPPETPPFEAPHIESMTKVQKLAALLIILGPESAARILQTLEPQELETVSVEMSRLPIITQELRLQILDEMSEIAVTAGTALRGGISFAQTTLEKAVGSSKANDILNRISPHQAPTQAIQRIMEMEPRHLFNLIREEHVQTIALMTSYLRPNKASEMLSLLRPELRDQVVERLALLEPVPLEVVEKVAEVLQRRLSGKTSRGLSISGGAKSAADVLNALDKNLSKTILASLDERNAQLGQAIRQKMFTFEDLLLLDTNAIQKVLREVDMRDLALALKKADEGLKSKLLGGISKRAAETVNEEMGFMGSVKLKEIEAAQLRIIEVVRRLENDGEIELDTTRETAAAA